MNATPPSERGVSMQHIPTAGRWAVYIGLAVVFAIACAVLADWQFARNEDRAAALELVERNYDAAPLPISEVVEGTEGFAPGDEWLPVVMHGTYLADQQLVVRNRPRGGTSAFEVLTPLRLTDGRIVIVDRGWVPPASDSADPADIPPPPRGDVTVIGRLRPSEPLPSSGRGAPDGQVPTIHLPLVAQQTGPGTVTATYALLVSEDPAAPTRPAPIDPPTSDPGPHLSYAIQWILFAVMGFVFIGYVIRTEVRHRREDAEDRAAAGRTEDDRDAVRAVRPRREGRRRDRDMQDEDEILDATRRG